MKHSLIIIPLSDSEEDMLRLISHGLCPANDLRSGDLNQLTNLGLVEQIGGGVGITKFGEIRLAQSKDLQLQALIEAARARQPNWRAA